MILVPVWLLACLVAFAIAGAVGIVLLFGLLMGPFDWPWKR